MPEQEPVDASAIARPELHTPSTDTAFTAFYRETVQHLVGFLVLHGATLADAADVAQETLCAAYQRWDTIHHPRAWAFRVASRGLVRKLTSLEDPVGEPVEPTPLLRGTDIGNWEQEQDIRNAMVLLPPRQRQVMAWTLYDYTPTEIARELDMTAEAVRASLKKARRKLARYLTETEGTS